MHISFNCRVCGISAVDSAAMDAKRINSASARMARHLANIACTLEVWAFFLPKDPKVSLLVNCRLRCVSLHFGSALPSATSALLRIARACCGTLPDSDIQNHMTIVL